MNAERLLPVDRFMATLEIVAKEAKHLSYSYSRLYSQKIDATWVGSLEENPEMAERLEAFVSRYGRIQDTIADKLLPRWYGPGGNARQSDRGTQSCRKNGRVGKY